MLRIRERARLRPVPINWLDAAAVLKAGLRRPLQQLVKVVPPIEGVVALAIALTLLAVLFREPLTRRTLDLGPEAAGTAFYTYAYGDSSSGGKSTAARDPKRPLAWTCTLKAGFQDPYCGFGLLFDRNHTGHGIDFAAYDSASLRLAYQGSERLVRISLKNHDPQYAQFAGSPDKPDEAAFPIHNGEQIIPLNLADFAVAEWWKTQTHAPAAFARPSFHDVVAMEIISGAEGKLGAQSYRIEGLRFERHTISVEAWYGAIGLAWLAFIFSILLFRRRQIAAIRRAGDMAIRESERLYRGILESTSDTIVVLDPNGEVQLVNGAGIAAMELDCADQVIGKHWTRLWRDESAETVAAALDQAADAKIARFRAFCATSKGTPKWWDVVVSPMLDDDGALKALLTISRDITVERQKSDQLQWASEHDALTHLPNRRAFQARLQAAIIRAMQRDSQVGLLLIDLDHFKHVNDSLGHSAGDELLKEIAARLRAGVREHDFVARIGGDEFAILVEKVPSDEVLLKVGNDILSMIHLPIRAAGRMIRASATIGGAIFPRNAASANDLFKNADTALYALKQNGRGGTRLFDCYMLDEAEKIASQLRLARGAVSERTVVPLYQPKFLLDGGGVSGLEALLRWRHPRKGLQLPDTLEEAFSDYELASKIGEIMQNKVARDMRSWLDRRLDFGRVAINAAPAEFLRDDYAERLLSVMEAHRIPPDRIEVEITEHAFLGRATEYVARALAVLKAAGTTLSLDDFGTGSSSLAHLRDFPVDVVKIDKSFVQKMTDDEEIAAIVTAVVRLARSLSINVVAEGVETPAQIELLRAMGCQIAQGHFFAAALEADAVARLMTPEKAAA